MKDEQKGAFFLIAGLIMLMGTMGGVEVSPNLISYDGLYLFAFTVAGLALMMVGASYVNDRTEQTMKSLRRF
jgi:uncharacterized membrane protein